MQFSARPRLRRASGFILFAISAALLAACASPQPKAMVNKKTSRSKEYFAETEYGVKASPRVAAGYGDFRRGGGRDQLGKPYQVRGKWYYPKEDKGYSKKGLASWYGDAFHGRLTANGEVYDMTHLTAAHPTMPLPSYARVTNLETGSSVIVRVNDRGPYHDGRIIDVSKRAAEMLDYARNGTARVKVDYVGRAPLDGDDTPYLVASYHSGNRAPDPSDGLPTGVMIAMNGATPSVGVGASVVPFPGQLTNSDGGMQPVAASQTAALGAVALPEFGPIVPERPDVSGQPPFAMASLSYADERVDGASRAFASMERGAMSSEDLAKAWKRANPAGNKEIVQAYVAAGSFETEAEARRVAGRLSDLGETEVQHGELEGRDIYSVNLYPANGDVDTALQAAWSHGAPDALAVRD